MIKWKSALIKHCESIEEFVFAEKKKLQSAKSELRECENRNLLLEKERKELEKRDEEIQRFKKQIQSLTNVYERIRNEILLVENRKVTRKVFDSKRRSQKLILEEIDTLKVEIEKLDKKLEIMKQTNSKIAKENKKKLNEFIANSGSIIKRTSSATMPLNKMKTEQKELKQALDALITKKTKMQNIIRELEKNMVLAENECMLKEKDIRRKECMELERHLALIEKVYLQEENIKSNLEFKVGKAQKKLHLLIMEGEQNQQDELGLLKLEINKNERTAEELRKIVENLGLVVTNTQEELREIRKKNAEETECHVKGRDEIIKTLNSELAQLKEENTKLDKRVEHVLKTNKWVKKFEKNVTEEQEDEEKNAVKALTRLRAEEKDEKEKLQKIKETWNKAQKNIDHLLRMMLDIQSQCYTEEKFLEDLTKSLQEIDTIKTQW